MHLVHLEEAHKDEDVTAPHAPTAKSFAEFLRNSGLVATITNDQRLIVKTPDGVISIPAYAITKRP